MLKAVVLITTASSSEIALSWIMRMVQFPVCVPADQPRDCPRSGPKGGGRTRELVVDVRAHRRNLITVKQNIMCMPRNFHFLARAAKVETRPPF